MYYAVLLVDDFFSKIYVTQGMIFIAYSPDPNETSVRGKVQHPYVLIQYSSDTGSTLKCKELVFYNYVIRISIYALLPFPSFRPRLPHIAVYCRTLLYIAIHLGLHMSSLP